MGEWIAGYIIFLLVIIPFSVITMPGSQGIPGNDDVLIIDVEGNDELEEFALSQGSTGNGTSEDPYVIEGLELSNIGPYDGITFKNTTFHFILKNTIISQEDLIPPGEYGSLLYVWNCTNLSFENCRFISIDIYGVFLEDSSNIVLRDCMFDMNRTMFSCILFHVDNITIESSIFSAFFPNYGIYGYHIDNLNLTDCFIEGYRYGLEIHNIKNSILSNNTITNCFMGMVCQQSGDSIFENNMIVNTLDEEFEDELWGGLYVGRSTNDIIINNHINSRNGISVYLGFQTEVTGNSIESIDESMYIIDCLDMVIEENVMMGKGIHMTNTMDQASVKRNTVNGRKVVYRNGVDLRGALHVDNIGQIIFNDVRNSTIIGLELSNVVVGIDLTRCSDIIVKNCKVENTDYGFTLSGCEGISFVNCEISNSWSGIWSYESKDLIIEDSLIQCLSNGFHTENNQRVQFKNNRIISKHRGILLETSSEINVSFNSIEAPSPLLQRSAGTNVYLNNSFKGGRLQINDEGLQTWEGVIEGNTQNGLNIYFFIDEKVEEIPEDGGFYFFYQCNNVDITNITLKGAVEFHGSRNIRFQNVTMNNSTKGLKMKGTKLIHLEDVLVEYVSNGSGINIDQCTDVTMSNVEISNCLHGLWLNKTKDCTIRSSVFSNNEGDGIQVLNDTDPFFIGDSEINGNGRYGLDVTSSVATVISNNFFENGDYGIRLRYSSGCTIHSNQFIDNNGVSEVYNSSRPQAFDMYNVNTWSIKDQKETFGNYWSDHHNGSLDRDGDGFLDVPYILGSDETASDDHPSVKRFDEVERSSRDSIDWNDIGLMAFFGFLSIVLLSLFFLPIVGSIRRKS
jgi:parallel beta-helix repeat protein